MQKKTDVLHSELSSTVFYDNVSNEYDKVIDSDSFNKGVRQSVATYFKSQVRGGSKVMDFGGGTGADLDWLTGGTFEVFFCEPSLGMRTHAMHLVDSLPHSDRVTFVSDDLLDFSKWELESFGSEKFDAVLANFAVLNCIENIPLLYKKLTLATKPGALIFTTVLDTRFTKIIKTHPKRTIHNIIFKTPIKVIHDQNGHFQPVFLHRKRELIDAAGAHFKLRHLYQLGHGFILMVWQHV